MLSRRFFQFRLSVLLLILVIAPPILYFGYVTYLRPEPVVIQLLTSRDKNLVDVALSGLRVAGFEVTERIDVDRPYAESAADLRRLVRRLRRLRSDEMEAIDDEVLSYWSVMSPMYPDSDWK